MNSEKFILINLNQNISRARQVAEKETRDKWIIFGLLCFIFIGISAWFVSINKGYNQLVQAREDTIASIKQKTSNLRKDAKINLSKGDILSSYDLGKKHIPWSRKLIQLSEMTPNNMCITKLVYDHNSLTISAISKIENQNQKEQQILNDFMNSIQNNEDFYKEFEKIKIKKTKKSQSKDTPFLAFEISARLKEKLDNRLDDIVLNEKIEILKKKKKKKKKKKEKGKKVKKYSDEIVKLAESINISNPDGTDPVREFQKQLDIYTSEDNMYGIFDSKTILVYGDVLNIKEETSWEKEYKERNKMLAGNYENIKMIPKSDREGKIPYDKLTIEVANKIASGNLNYPDPELVKNFQELVGLATENDSWYGTFTPKTVDMLSKVLGIEG